MKARELKRCQVETPPEVVDLLWRCARMARSGAIFDSVLDLGAGDARFSRATGAYREYIGIEMDPRKAITAKLPTTARLVVGDAMSWERNDHCLAIGNPPFIRHHGLEEKWRKCAQQAIVLAGGPELKATANAFVLFLAQALLKTRKDGLVVQLVPYEWVTRPSALELRKFIDRNEWKVEVYRFDSNIFPSVLTTASITIIDKASKRGGWGFGRISSDGVLTRTSNSSGSRHKVLPYDEGASNLRGIRGLSPGSQDIFVLTEAQRLHFGLKKRVDVAPCVTTLRAVDADLESLCAEAFDLNYVTAGRPCWLIRSDRPKISSQLEAYLQSVGDRWRSFSTCSNRTPWWRYRIHPAPQLLVSSGFVDRAPKVLFNEIGAVAVGSVYGVLSNSPRTAMVRLLNDLRAFNFEARVVHHANHLKKIEVRQLNAVLNLLKT